MRSLVLAILLSSSLLILGCSGSGSDSASSRQGASRENPQQGQAPAENRDTARESADPEQIAVVKGLSFVLPEDWKSVAPSSNMRAFEAKHRGDETSTTLALFHFGEGGGGSPEANFQRWLGQIELEDPDDAAINSEEINNTVVKWLDVQGTLKANQMGGPEEAVPDARLIGIIVEGEGGPWFIKITGKNEVLEDLSNVLEREFLSTFKVVS